MKAKSEIYCVKFNRCVVSNDILWTTYTLNVPVAIGNPTCPLKIILSKDNKHITIYFSNDTSLTIGYTEDVQVYKRKITEEK